LILCSKSAIRRKAVERMLPIRPSEASSMKMPRRSGLDLLFASAPRSANETPAPRGQCSAKRSQNGTRMRHPHPAREKSKRSGRNSDRSTRPFARAPPHRRPPSKQRTFSRWRPPARTTLDQLARARRTWPARDKESLMRHPDRAACLSLLTPARRDAPACWVKLRPLLALCTK
jgi:hypothetical protein